MLRALSLAFLCEYTSEREGVREREREREEGKLDRQKLKERRRERVLKGDR